MKMVKCYCQSIGKSDFDLKWLYNQLSFNSDFDVIARPRSAIGRAPDSWVRSPGFDTLSGNILSFLLPLFQEGQLSVTGESMCTKYWLTA